LDMIRVASKVPIRTPFWAPVGAADLVVITIETGICGAPRQGGGCGEHGVGGGVPTK